MWVVAFASSFIGAMTTCLLVQPAIPDWSAANNRTYECFAYFSQFSEAAGNKIDPQSLLNVCLALTIDRTPPKPAGYPI